MKVGIVSALVAAVCVVTGCGAAEVSVHSQSAQPVALQVPEHCVIDFRTIATASEAFWATTGVYPTNQGELVNAGFLRQVIDDFELSIITATSAAATAGTSYAVVGTQDCAGFDPDESSFDTEPVSTSVPSSCDSDLKTLEVAWEAYNADYGNPPQSEADLVNAGFLVRESTGFDLVGTEFVPVPGVCA